MNSDGPAVIALAVLLVTLAAPAQAGGAGPAPPARSAPAATPTGKPTQPAHSGGAAFDDLAARAKQAHTEQKLDEAVDLYQRALRMRPGWTEGRFALGTVFYDLDRYEEARAAFRRVAVDWPKSGPAWGLRGVCDYRLKDYETALANLQKGLALGLGANAELQSVVNYHAAVLLTRFGQPEAAYEILKGFAMRDYDSPSIIEALGLSALRLPYLPSEAPTEKREMIVMTGRAVYQLVKNRRSAAAKTAFDELVTRFPEEPNVRYAYGVFLLRDSPEAALAEFRGVLRMQPSNLPAMLQIVAQLIKVGDFQGAQPYADKAASIAPGHTAARAALGRVLLENGDIQRAITELEEAVRLGPQNEQAYFALARAYQRAERAADARRTMAVFVELDKARRARNAPGPESQVPQE